MFHLFIQAVSVLMLAAYCFISLMYQHLVVWFVVPIILLFVLRHAIKTEPESKISAAETLLLLVLPVILSLGLLLRTGGPTDQGAINLTLVSFFSGVAIVSINYFLFRGVRYRVPTQ